MFDPRMQPTARLAYVVKKIPGKVKRPKCRWVPNKSGKGGELVTKDVEVDGGYMVYFPKGHAIRLTAKQLKQYNLDQPRGNFVSMQGLTPQDEMMMLEDRSLMQAHVESIEMMTIRLATRRTGPLLMPEQLTGIGQAPGVEAPAEA